MFATKPGRRPAPTSRVENQAATAVLMDLDTKQYLQAAARLATPRVAAEVLAEDPQP